MSDTDKVYQEGAASAGTASVQDPLFALIRRCIAQDRKAQKQLYEEYAPLLYGIIKRYTYNRGEADEILNDSFYKIFTSLHSFAFTGSFEGWMRRIAVNCITDNFRKYIKNEPAYKLEVENVDVFTNESALGKMSYKELLQKIHELPGTQRAVFNLFVFEQLSHKEIAEHLGINENNSRWHLNDARKRLKEKIMTSM